MRPSFQSHARLKEGKLSRIAIERVWVVHACPPSHLRLLTPLIAYRTLLHALFGAPCLSLGGASRRTSGSCCIHAGAAERFAFTHVPYRSFGRSRPDTHPNWDHRGICLGCWGNSTRCYTHCNQDHLCACTGSSPCHPPGTSTSSHTSGQRPAPGVPGAPATARSIRIACFGDLCAGKVGAVCGGCT